MEVNKLYRVCSVDDDSVAPQGKLGIISNSAYITVDMSVKVKSLVTAYKRFTQAISQAVADKALPATYDEFATVDSITESDILNLQVLKSKDIHFDLDDNNDIGQGFYLKLAVHKKFFDTVVSLPAPAEELPVVVEDVSNLPAVQTDYSALVEKWIDFTKKHSGLKSAQSERAYRNAIKQALNYFAERGVSILAANDDDIYSWLEHLKEEKSPSTVQMYLVAVRLFFAFLHKQKIIADNPCEGMKAGVKIDRDKHNRDYLSVKRAQELIAKMPTETEMQLRNRAIVSLMVTSGLRCCEVQKALYEDLRTAGDSEVLYIQGKGHTSKDDYVKVAPAVGNMIRDYLKVRFKGNEPKARDYLFVSTSRNHATFDKDDELSTQAIRAIVKKAMKDIGFEDSRHTAHSLRHTAATLMLRSGEDLNNVKQVLRHSNVQTTMIYAHALEREKNNAELAVSNLLFGEIK